MCRRVNRHEDCTEKQSQQMQATGREGRDSTVLTVFLQTRNNCGVKEDRKEEWRQRQERLREKRPLSVLALE